MKIKIPRQHKQQQKWQSKTYITDDTRELDSNSLLVCTKSNQSFIDKIFKTTQNLQNDISDFIITPKELANLFAPLPKLIGITGTNGKTTTAAIIYSILLDLGFSCGLFGTRGAYKNDKKIRQKGLTTPTLLAIYELLNECRDCDFVIMEVSSHAIHQERIAGLEFISKVLTNITSDHLDYHKTLEEYIRLKNHFLLDEENLAKNGSVIINADEPNALFNACRKDNVLSYGIEMASAGQVNLKTNAYSLDNGINAHISLEIDTKHDDKCKKIHEQALISVNLYGKHNLYNVLAAILCVKSLERFNVSKNAIKSNIVDSTFLLETIIEQLKNFGGVEGRMEVISQNPLIIVDFAHTHDGMKQIFESFRGREIVVVFGAGGDRDKTKRPKMGLCAYNYAKKLYITSDNPRSENPLEIINDIVRGIPTLQTTQNRQIICEPDRKIAITKAIQELEQKEILLILGKGDETYQILGDKSVEFDDREVAREVLKQLALHKA